MEKSREGKREKETLLEESVKDQTNTYNVLGETFENYSDDLFTKRHKISFRAVTSQVQKIPADAKILDHQFLTFVTEKKIEYGITQVANMDETPLWFDLPNPKSYDFRGIKTVKAKTTGHEKLRYTVVLSAIENRLDDFIVISWEHTSEGFSPSFTVWLRKRREPRPYCRALL